MTFISDNPNWGRYGIPALLAVLVAAGYYVGSLSAPPALPSAAQQDAMAEQALATGHDSFAISILQKLAKTGDVKAEYQLGEIYSIGDGTPKNGKLAQSWLTKAATGNNVNAELQLGQMYLNGQLIVQDFAQAHIWLTKAANTGNATALRLLGDMEAEGLGQKANPVSAYAWYEVAALKGDAYAQIKRNKILAKLDPSQQQQGEADAKTRLGRIDAASANKKTASTSSTATAPAAPAKPAPAATSTS